MDNLIGWRKVAVLIAGIVAVVVVAFSNLPAEQTKEVISAIVYIASGFFVVNGVEHLQNIFKVKK